MPSLACAAAGRGGYLGGNAEPHGHEPQRPALGSSSGHHQGDRTLTPSMAATIQPCRRPCDRWLRRLVCELADTIAAIGQLLAQTDQRLAGNRVVPDRLVSPSDPDTHPIGQRKPPFAGRVWPQAAAGRRPARLRRRHQLAQARTSLTGPPAQTAYCSGAAINRWWHPSEQK